MDKGEYRSEVRDGMRIDWDVPVPMPDGTVLPADVYRPSAEGRYPVIMTHGPYAKGLAFQSGFAGMWKPLSAKYPDAVAGSSNRYQNWETADPEKWVPDGYACVRVDSRGAGRSPGRLSAGNWGHDLHTRGNFEGYAAASSGQKWLEVHGLEHFAEFYTDYGVALQKRFFGHFLKGEDTGWDRQPPVQLNVRHVDGSFELRAEQEWPLARTAWTEFHLDAQHATSCCASTPRAADRPAQPPPIPQGSRHHRKHCATRGGTVFFHHIRNVGWVDAH